MDAEKQYIDLFIRHADILRNHAPAVMNQQRAGAFECFKRNGFPGSDHDNYHHTEVKQIFGSDYGLNLNRLQIPVNPNHVFQCDVPNLNTSLHFVVNDSFFTNNLSRVSLPEGVFAGSLKYFMEKYPEIASHYYGKAVLPDSDSVAALNTMLVQDGFVLYVPQGVKVETPVQLVQIFRSDVDLMANRRMLIILEPEASAKLLVCDHSMDEVKFLGTQVVEIFAGENARFDYYDLEESSISTIRFSSVFVEQAAYSNVLVNGITLNNGLSRNDYHIRLNGEQASATLCGLAILDQNQQVDTFSHITHSVPYCTSNELFKNVLGDQSKVVFNGRILVKEGAEKTVAYQTNRNLCTTHEARAYSRPQLEIYADDVKCSHGMSMGQLDENALFYMRSRGLSGDEARMMLSIAFTQEVIDYVRLDILKNRLNGLVEKRFRGELARCANCVICQA
ncbi:MAG: Fe-S cluster assembly protein SufD [Tannerella sp.]|jgi:Fe-S cluster assembly protein SufD|nr:Fe-S cluster assembly protein SufD [Tannerella sp.]